MWELLTHENVEELLSLLRNSSDASNISVLLLIRALEHHPSLPVPPAISADAFSSNALSTTAPRERRARKAKECCRNGQKVVEIRKALPFGGGEDSTVNVDRAEGCGARKNADMAENCKGAVKTQRENEGKGPLKPKVKAKSNLGKRKRDCTAEKTSVNREKKWKTDGQPPVTNDKADALIIEMATIGERRSSQEFSDFLTGVISASMCELRSIDMLSDFPALVRNCGMGETKSAVADFFHMMSLILLALYIDK
jgi:hypothetical protein